MNVPTREASGYEVPAGNSFFDDHADDESIKSTPVERRRKHWILLGTLLVIVVAMVVTMGVCASGYCKTGDEGDTTRNFSQTSSDLSPDLDQERPSLGNGDDGGDDSSQTALVQEKGTGGGSGQENPSFGEAGTFDPIRINCGSNETTMDPQDQSWTGDEGFYNVLYGESAYDNSSAITGTNFSELFYAYRYFTGYNLTGPASYEIPLVDGIYGIVLYFAETFFEGPCLRIFDIAIEDSNVTTNLDIAAQVGINTALKLGYTANVTDGSLSIDLIPVLDLPIIMGIEVLDPSDMPNDTVSELLNTTFCSDVPSDVPSETPTTQIPTSPPSILIVPTPTEAPGPAPTDAPVPAPTEAPVPAPTEAPVPAPTEAPVPAPTEAPVPAPTEAPIPQEVVPTDPPTPTPPCFICGDANGVLNGDGIVTVGRDSIRCADLDDLGQSGESRKAGARENKEA